MAQSATSRGFVARCGRANFVPRKTARYGVPDSYTIYQLLVVRGHGGRSRRIVTRAASNAHLQIYERRGINCI